MNNIPELKYAVEEDIKAVEWAIDHQLDAMDDSSDYYAHAAIAALEARGWRPPNHRKDESPC